MPFEAVSGFFDPSVQFGLKFEVVTSEPEVSDVAPSPPPVLAPLRPAIRGAASEPDEAPALAKPAKAAKGEGGKGEKKAQAKPLKVVAPSEDAQDKGGEAEKVVSLDTFRKKNSPPLCPSPGRCRGRGATAVSGRRASRCSSGRTGRTTASKRVTNSTPVPICSMVPTITKPQANGAMSEKRALARSAYLSP